MNFSAHYRALVLKQKHISGEPLNINFCNVALYSTNQRHSTHSKYKSENNDNK